MAGRLEDAAHALALGNNSLSVGYWTTTHLAHYIYVTDTNMIHYILRMEFWDFCSVLICSAETRPN